MPNIDHSHACIFRFSRVMVSNVTRDINLRPRINTSINETLSRTLLTSITTLFTCVAIWVVGTGVLKTFAIALTAGVLVGTYSSVFIASPMVIFFNERFGTAEGR